MNLSIIIINQMNNVMNKYILMKISKKFIINQNLFDKIYYNPIIFIQIIINRKKVKFNSS